MREFTRASMGMTDFNEFVDEVYRIEEGQVFRKRDKLERAFRAGYGWSMHLSLCGMLSMLSLR